MKQLKRRVVMFVAWYARNWRSALALLSLAVAVVATGAWDGEH